MEQHPIDRRMACAGIEVNHPDRFYPEPNDILRVYSSLIVGRQALPCRRRPLSLIHRLWTKIQSTVCTVHGHGVCKQLAL